jgi:hypothetical protein
MPGFMDEPINLAQKLALFDERFSPRIVATMNDYKVEVVKVEGEFVWKGDLFVVPRGVEHRPRARREAHILLIEPQGTPNTGDAVDSELTAPERAI